MRFPGIHTLALWCIPSYGHNCGMLEYGTVLPSNFSVAAMVVVRLSTIFLSLSGQGMCSVGVFSQSLGGLWFKAFLHDCEWGRTLSILYFLSIAKLVNDQLEAEY